ncbi:hypothetical protein GTR02_15175 [Kineococcus sp. R8]|uniref:hypothetical protein n=1 Tax=Kineococcus siccus TaxID=2696567 RepID=UPI001412CF65|nr:hypothetical protein [Kineococcus siccus]NAZ83161.1 hypothetical protein [Kineococcus siccus]
MTEPYAESYQDTDRELDPLDDPDLRAENSELASDDDADALDEVGALGTDTLLADDDDDTYDTTRSVSHATEVLMSDDVDADNETIEERLTQEVPDESGGTGASGLGDHVAAADDVDPERV